MSYLGVGTTTKLIFIYRIMWELLQTKILQTNLKIVGTHTFIKSISQPNSC